MNIGLEKIFTFKENITENKINNLKRTNLTKLDDNKIKEVCQEFESIFIEQLFKSMRKTIQKNDWLNGGLKQEIFEDMLYQEYSKNIAKADSFGLWKIIYKSLKNS